MEPRKRLPREKKSKEVSLNCFSKPLPEPAKNWKLKREKETKVKKPF
jgi:hypothetical protein